MSFTSALLAPSPAAWPGPTATEQFQRLAAKGQWKEVGRVGLGFNTFHPQGLVKIGNDFYLSAAEVVSKPSKFLFAHPDRDRTPGKGRAHLFHFNGKGQLLGQVVFGGGDSYHPGGIDTDGRRIWIPVAEYRPHGATIIYRVSCKDLNAGEVFRFADHIGAVIFDPHRERLYGTNWGSKNFYAWTKKGRLLGETPNRFADVKYQDCHFAGWDSMICGGASDALNPIAGFFPHGGISLIDLRDYHIVARIRSPWVKRSNMPMTRNATFFERVGDRLRFYFVPEDHHSTLYIYDLE